MTNNDEIYWGQHTTQAQKRKQIPITRERKETKQSGKQRNKTQNLESINGSSFVNSIP